MMLTRHGLWAIIWQQAQGIKLIQNVLGTRALSDW